MRNETHRDKGPNINCLDRSGRPVEFSSRSLQLYSIDWLLLVFLNFSWVLPFVSCSGQYQLSCTTLTHSISSSSLLDVWPWRSWLPARRHSLHRLVILGFLFSTSRSFNHDFCENRASVVSPNIVTTLLITSIKDLGPY